MLLGIQKAPCDNSSLTPPFNLGWMPEQCSCGMQAVIWCIRDKGWTASAAPQSACRQRMSGQRPLVGNDSGLLRARWLEWIPRRWPPGVVASSVSGIAGGAGVSGAFSIVKCKIDVAKNINAST